MDSPDSTRNTNITECSIAIGLPVFTRTKALKKCLESVDGKAIDRAIIADNGETDERRSLYARDWDFELTVLDINYDSGIGACRSAIADELTEEFLIVADNDMIIPPASRLQDLIQALNYNSNLGAVSGIVVEDSRIRSGCSNLHEQTLFNGDKILVHSIQTDPNIEWVKPTLPIARFDKLTNAAIVRRECIEDYSWDKRFPHGEHLDFYIGHHIYTNWDFAVCPTVIFDHQKGRYSIYREEVRSSGENYEKKHSQMSEMFLKKWKYKRIEYGYRPEWIDTKQEYTGETVYRMMNKYLPMRYILPFRDAVEIIR